MRTFITLLFSLTIFSSLAFKFEKVIKPFDKEKAFQYGKGKSFVSDRHHYIHILGLSALSKRWQKDLSAMGVSEVASDNKYVYFSAKVWKEKLTAFTQSSSSRKEWLDRTFPVVYHETLSFLAPLSGRIEIYTKGVRNFRRVNFEKSFGADEVERFEEANYISLVYSDKVKVLDYMTPLSRRFRSPGKLNVHVLTPFRRTY